LCKELQRIGNAYLYNAAVEVSAAPEASPEGFLKLRSGNELVTPYLSQATTGLEEGGAS